LKHRDGNDERRPPAQRPEGRGRSPTGPLPKSTPAVGAAGIPGLPLTGDAPWQPDPETFEKVDALIRGYRAGAVACLEPPVRSHYPELLATPEYGKMLELSTKMTLVGHAACEIAGYSYDEHRQTIGTLFGCCCFLADSFVDDFGPEATREYLDRIRLLLTTGWFDVRTERERLFYAIVGRLFAARDVLDPILRQAIMLLFDAQKRDCELRLSRDFAALPRRARLRLLRVCARDRSGHAITVLTGFVAPRVEVAMLPYLFTAGALIMHIDDHGDCYADLRDGRLTYLNQVRNPAATLRKIFFEHAARLHAGLPPSDGRDLMLAFLTRYFLTRIEKHRLQKEHIGSAWAVYE
jgi:hypothetical protein